MNLRAAFIVALVLSSGVVLAEGAQYRLYVDGLACPFCAYGIEKQLRALEGVETVETQIREGVVIVTLKEAHALDEATATRAVRDAGFTLNRFEEIGK